VEQDIERPRAPASDRLQLEVSLLAGATTRSEDSARAGEARRHYVLVAVGDPDLCSYVVQCLRERDDLRVEEVGAGESPFALAERVNADLVIVNESMITGSDAARATTPLLVTGDEQPEHLPVGDGRCVAFLLQPFNSKRLLEFVERLLRP
jgi:hypothetical protein